MHTYCFSASKRRVPYGVKKHALRSSTSHRQNCLAALKIKQGRPLGRQSKPLFFIFVLPFFDQAMGSLKLPRAI